MKSKHTGAKRSVVCGLLSGSVAVLAAASTLGCSSAAGSSPDEGTGGFAGYAGFPQGSGGFQQGNGGFVQQGNGGFQQGNGGFVQQGNGGFVQQGSGGFVQQGSGGFVQGNGGFVQGSGGFDPGSGGFSQGTGGDPFNTGGAQQGTGGAPPAAQPPCLSAANQAAIIGDSYVTGAASPDLYTALATAYPFSSGFRRYAVPGTSMASGGLTGLIPPQWDQAAAGGTTKFLIMDGGGNDILICNTAMYPGCNTQCKSPGSSQNAQCKDIVAKAVTAAEGVMQKAANAGLKDVVYFFYPNLPGANAGYKEITQYAEPLARASCETAFTKTGGKLNCYFVPLAAPFAAAGGDANPANFVADAIHPSAAGQKIIATEIYKVMQDHCLGQQSGCCAP